MMKLGTIFSSLVKLNAGRMIYSSIESIAIENVHFLVGIIKFKNFLPGLEGRKTRVSKASGKFIYQPVIEK